MSFTRFDLAFLLYYPTSDMCQKNFYIYYTALSFLYSVFCVEYFFRYSLRIESSLEISVKVNKQHNS